MSENIDKLLKKGMECINKKDYSSAQKYFVKALIESPNNVVIHNNLAGLYYYTNDIDNAVKHWKKILEINPNCEFADDARKNLSSVTESSKENELNKKINKFKGDIASGKSSSISLSMDEWDRLKK